MKGFSHYIDAYYKLMLLTLFLVAWIWSVWNPANQTNWYLENKMVLLFIPIIYFIFIKYIQFSRLSLTFVTLFLILHIVGSHYGYGSVPFGARVGSWIGTGTNVYDKLVHFSFGFLIVYPLREFFLRIAKINGFWGYVIPFSMVLALSSLYEMFEWISVLQYGPEIGYIFIGGNDPFDTTKDMTAAGIGSILALLIVLAYEIMDKKHNFWKYIKNSFAKDNLTYPKEDKLLHEKILS